MKLTLKEIADFCGGTLFGDSDTEITGFFTDSRKAEIGRMFVPIIGENVDSHKFIPSVEGKCSATFSAHKLETDMPYILTDSCVASLQRTAEKYRETFSIPFIGITGSVGKTTTKEMIALALESSLKVHKTAGNANSQVGLPQSVLGTEKCHEASILEIGMSYPGEIIKSSKVAKVDIAVVTNIGVSHIEYHGSKENIFKEKMCVTNYMRDIAFVNGDDPLLASIKNPPYNMATFGIGENCDFRGENIVHENGITNFTYDYQGKTYKVMIPVLGDHNIRNALVALAICHRLGLDIDRAIKALGTYTPPDMRQQVKTHNSITVIDDSYNASPDSTMTAIDVLTGFKGRKIAVLADMLELGNFSQSGHEDVGKYAKKKNIDFLIAIGEESKFIEKGFDNKEKSKHFMTNKEVIDFISTIKKDNDVFLVKGSRGMRTDEIVEYLLNS